ncbi:hypothetical protein EUTSA_v10012244mg, partial [Eutrema salsugineum]
MERGKYFSRSKPPCPLSDPANPHKLCRRSDPPLSMCFACKGQQHLEEKSFSLHSHCALNPPPLTIQNLKSHDHTLTLFPRRIPLPCDACGFSLDSFLDQVYSCLLCNYLVHRRCIYLPRVIKITRHLHRLSHTSSFVPSSGEIFSCGVCHKPVDVNYGQFSCNKGCHYAVHSQCAIKDEVWDGIDLEGVPEKKEEVLEPFVRIDEETIQHFTHEHHHLKIHGNDNRGDHENKFCQACILPMKVSDRFYSCIDCDFVLHETCASLPRKQHHPVHKHPLTLFYPFSPNPHEFVLEYGSFVLEHGYFDCSGCYRASHGFMHKCTKKDCDFHLDASLNSCIKCKSFLSLRCATLPSLAHYKHDKHSLWCEICERKLDATELFYTCSSCLVTLHVECLLGIEMYMKPNHSIQYDGYKVDIGRKSGNTRPVCDRCRRRCKDTLVFK